MAERHWRMGVRALAGCAAAAAVCMAGSCNIAGPAIFFIMGPEKVPPAYVLDKKRSVLVLVDDTGSRVPEQLTRRRIALAAEQSFLDNKVVEEVIGCDAAAAVVSKERFGSPMGIVDVGRAVGAKVVVYALVEEFTLVSQAGVYSPRARVRMKAVDAEAGKRLWPEGEPGSMTLTVELPAQGNPPQAQGEIVRSQQLLADRLGEGIAKVFFEHEASPNGERSETRARELRS